MEGKHATKEDSITLTEGKKKKKKHGKYKAFNKMVEINPRKLIVTTFVNRTKSLMKE